MVTHGFMHYKKIFQVVIISTLFISLLACEKQPEESQPDRYEELKAGFLNPPGEERQAFAGGLSITPVDSKERNYVQ